MKRLLVLLLAALATACFHWAPVENITEIEGAKNVRIEPDGAAPYILRHPSIDEVRTLAQEQHARVTIRKLNGWMTALAITGYTLLTVGAVLALFGWVIAAAGVAGG